MKEYSYKESAIQFFDEMNILKSEKKERVDSALTMSDLMRIFLLNVFSDIVSGKFLHEITDEKYLEKLMNLYDDFVYRVDKSIAYDSDIIAKARQFAQFIHETNKKIVYEQEDTDFIWAITYGMPINEKDVPSKVKERFTGKEAPILIGQNESLFIHNYIRHKSFLNQNRATHTWETMQDEKVRVAHIKADGQTVPIDQPFIIGGYKLMFPGDTLTSNPPADIVVNCRCVEI